MPIYLVKVSLTWIWWIRLTNRCLNGLTRRNLARDVSGKAHRADILERFFNFGRATVFKKWYAASKNAARGITRKYFSYL